jgi:hypothetical protein
MKRWTLLMTVAALVAVLGNGTVHACVGAECLEIWSTADGGGALTVQWDFTKPMQTYPSLCAPGNSPCPYSTIDQGFIAPTTDGDPTDSYYVLKDGTPVSIVIMPPPPDPVLSLNINGQQLQQPGDTYLLGVMPTIHIHPSWQILAAPNELGTFNVSFKLTMSCSGDCNGNGTVTVDEVLTCVNVALGAAVSTCLPCDRNHDGMVTVDEILAVVTAALDGCPAPYADSQVFTLRVTNIPPPTSSPTPTPTPEAQLTPLPSQTPTQATLQQIQDAIFTPRCAIGTCHDSGSAAQNLDLSAGASYSQLVNVPSVDAAGVFRVDPGKPDDSFLVIKVQGPPPPGEGSQMPLAGPLLSADQIQLIRNWILEGANP